MTFMDLMTVFEAFEEDLCIFPDFHESCSKCPFSSGCQMKWERILKVLEKFHEQTIPLLDYQVIHKLEHISKKILWTMRGL